MLNARTVNVRPNMQRDCCLSLIFEPRVRWEAVELTFMILGENIPSFDRVIFASTVDDIFSSVHKYRVYFFGMGLLDTALAGFASLVFVFPWVWIVDDYMVVLRDNQHVFEITPGVRYSKRNGRLVGVRDRLAQIHRANIAVKQSHVEANQTPVSTCAE
jgi:hypothetical protein